MKVLPDAELFTPIKDGVGPTDYMKDACIARDATSVFILSSKIAAMGAKFQRDIHGPGIRGDREVAMWEYLLQQKLRIPISSRYASLASAGPITEDVVNEHLNLWNFQPENIQVRIKKRSKWFRYGCYVEVTFEAR